MGNFHLRQKTDQEKQLAIKWKNEGKSYMEICLMLNISKVQHKVCADMRRKDVDQNIIC